MRHFAALLLSALLLFPAASSAQRLKPSWVQKGVKSLNSRRTNDSYTFLKFDSYGLDINRLEEERHLSLLEYVGRKYHVSPDRLSIVPVDDASGLATCRISFTAADGVSEVYAQLVDDWSWYEDEVYRYGFKFHQLYAVSERNVAPAFDKFTLSDRYGFKPVLMSLIPGWGQIYKGQPGKGYAILGSEIVMAGGIVYGELERARYMRLGKNSPDAEASFVSRADTFRDLRNVCIIAGGIIYIYNLVDAAVAKGARRVIISRPDRRTAEFAFVPVVTEFGSVGVGMSVKF